MKRLTALASTLAIILVILVMVVVAYQGDSPVYFYIVMLSILIPSVMLYYNKFGRRR